MYILKDITVITTCKNRLFYLKQSLETWLKCSFKEIIIIDWDSDEPIHEQINENVTILRVENRSNFHAGFARNAGVRYSNASILFMIDCDVKLIDIDAILKLERNNIFYSGNPKVTGLSTTGTCLITREMYDKADGYSDLIMMWGHDDNDFYERLELEGYEHRIFPKDSISHINHSDQVRFEHRDQKGLSRRESAGINHKLVWNKSYIHEKVKVSGIYKNGQKVVSNIII